MYMQKESSNNMLYFLFPFPNSGGLSVSGETHWSISFEIPLLRRFDSGLILNPLIT